MEATGKIFQSRDRTGRDGRTINTAKIGRKPTAARKETTVINSDTGEVRALALCDLRCGV